MALIQCPECDGKVSDTIEICIHCGYKLKKSESVDSQVINKENTKECIHCKKIISSLADNCPHCGGDVRSPFRLIIALIRAIVGIIALISAIIYFLS